MDKIDAVSILDHLNTDPINLETPPVGEWFTDETTSLTDPEATEQGWMIASGWKFNKKTEDTDDDGNTIYHWHYTRRVLDTELALEALSEYYKDAYNEGRELNDTRYDEIVTLYAASLDKTEDEIIDLISDEDSFESLSTILINTLAGTWTDHNTDVGNLFDNYGDAETDRINDQFNALLSAKELEMRMTGRYNTTTWDAVEAGIEQDRAQALTELGDKNIRLEIDHKDRLFVLRRQVDDSILAARDRLFARIHGEGIARSSLRNQVIDLICRFAERRTDSYPSVEQIGNLSNSLGAGLPSNSTP